MFPGDAIDIGNCTNRMNRHKRDADAHVRTSYTCRSVSDWHRSHFRVSLSRWGQQAQPDLQTWMPKWRS